MIPGVPNREGSAGESKVESLFNAALALPPTERAGYLAMACGGDEGLFRRVEGLLRAHDSAQGFLPEQPGAEAGAPRSAAGATPAPDEVIQVAEQPGHCIGRYKLLEKVGEGGCGMVYVAEQQEPVRRRVALKVIKLGMDTRQIIARFEAERQALALMDHPNIAKVLDAGATKTGRPYFVMELVRGVKITEYCEQNRLSTHARLKLFIQVCHAVQHAHQKGIIHRDLKPSNILVTVNDGVPVPKVIDFGIAKATGGQELTDKTIYTALQQFIGTPAYMSPEQAVLTSVDIDTRSDIYSLGVLLYELLIGNTPFDPKELLATGFDDLRQAICETEPLRPSVSLSTIPGMELSARAQRRGVDARKLVGQLRGDLDWIVMKCLEKDRARRYDTANGLAMDLERHLTNQAVTARPPSRLYRLQKTVRRNKATFAAGTMVVAALVLGLGAATRMYLKEREALLEQVRLRQLAEASEQKAALESIRSRATDRDRWLDYYMGQHNYKDVDSTLAHLLTPAEANQTVYVPLLELRADYQARRGRLRDAAADYLRLTEQAPEQVLYYSRLAYLMVATGDLAGYRRLCKTMLARVAAPGRVPDAGVADLTAKPCCLLPPPEEDLAQIANLAQLASSLPTTNTVDVRPWDHLCTGLGEYRAGRYPSALQWMRQTLAEPCRYSDDCRYLTAWAVVTMAHYRLGQTNEARAACAEALKISRTLPGLQSSDLGLGWENLLVARTFLHEAENLLQPSAVTAQRKLGLQGEEEEQE